MKKLKQKSSRSLTNIGGEIINIKTPFFILKIIKAELG